MMAIRCCNVERRDRALVSIDVGMSIKKERDTLMMAILCCKVERCRWSTGIGTESDMWEERQREALTIDVGTSIKKERDTLMMAILCCTAERYS